MKTPARTLLLETVPVALLALIALWDANRLRTNYPDTVGSYEGAIWMILMAILLLVAIAAINIRPPPPQERAEEEPLRLAQPVSILALICIYIVGLDNLGFMISTSIFLIIYMIFISGLKPIMSIFISLLFSLVAAYIFDVLLVPLPSGLLF